MRWFREEVVFSICLISCVLVSSNNEQLDIRVLSGTHLIFLGDSILRQLYHTFVFGTIRGLPVIIDPVYGYASYKSNIPCPTCSSWEDSFQATGKLSHLEINNHQPEGWTPDSGVEVSFSFQQSCGQIVAALQQLKASKRLKASKVVIVIDIGATTVLGSATSIQCLQDILPTAVSSLALHFPRTHQPSHYFIVMDQPIKQTRLRNIPDSVYSTVVNATTHLLTKINRDSLVVAKLLKFRELVDRTGEMPVLEDDLHFGCMFGSVGRGRMSHPWGSSNEVGYSAAYLRGLHFQNNSCGLNCDAEMIRSLSQQLLSIIRPHSLEPRSLAQYKVASCVEEYSQLPCPLYPPAFMAHGWNLTSRHFSQKALISHNARKATFSDLLTKPFRGLSFTDAQGLFNHTLFAFESGGFEKCRKAPEHIRFHGHKWCERALYGPGGSLSPNSQNETLLPLGTWCALPAQGTFHFV